MQKIDILFWSSVNSIRKKPQRFLFCRFKIVLVLSRALFSCRGATYVWKMFRFSRRSEERKVHGRSMTSEHRFIWPVGGSTHA